MLMYDFYAGFSLEEPVTKERKDSLVDSTLRGIINYQNRNEILESFDMNYAMAYLGEMIEKHEKCNRCIIHIEEEEQVYVVTLVLLDNKNNPLKLTTKEVLGKRIRVKNLTEDVEKFMDGKKSRILTL